MVAPPLLWFGVLGSSPPCATFPADEVSSLECDLGNNTLTVWNLSITASAQFRGDGKMLVVDNYTRRVVTCDFALDNCR